MKKQCAHCIGSILPAAVNHRDLETTLKTAKGGAKAPPFAVLGENWLSFLSNNGELSGQYDYKGRYLKKGSLQGDGFAALLLSNSQSSSSGTLCTVNRKGEEIAQVEISEPVTTLAANGSYVAVLTANHLYLYNKDLELLSESSDVLGYSSIVLFEDGSMDLITEKQATLYLPK